MQTWSRPCLVLGSAPNPHVPVLEGMDVICVNSSGYVARNLGLPTPSLTVLAGFKLVLPKLAEDREALRGLRTKTLLLIMKFRDWTAERAAEALAALDYRYDELVTISIPDRAEIIRSTTGRRLGGEDGRPAEGVSNGLFAACYVLHAHAPKVVFAGISVTRNGHEYSVQDRARVHIEPDKTAIACLLARGYPLFTSEHELSAAAGLPLIAAASVAHAD